jgi:hypothetical protein
LFSYNGGWHAGRVAADGEVERLAARGRGVTLKGRKEIGSS